MNVNAEEEKLKDALVAAGFDLRHDWNLGLGFRVSAQLAGSGGTSDGSAWLSSPWRETTLDALRDLTRLLGER